MDIIEASGTGVAVQPQVSMWPKIRGGAPRRVEPLPHGVRQWWDHRE